MTDTQPNPNQNPVPQTNTTPDTQPQVAAPAVVEAAPVTPAPTSQDAVSQDISKLKGFMAKLKQGIKEKQTLAKAAKTSGAGSNIQVDAAKKPSFVGIFAKNKLLLVALAIFVVLCILLVAASVYKSLSNRKPTVVVPTPTPEALINATPSGLIVPSRYATDSAVLELETKINDLDKELTTTSIKESQLTPPTFDFVIKF